MHVCLFMKNTDNSLSLDDFHSLGTKLTIIAVINDVFIKIIFSTKCELIF